MNKGSDIVKRNAVANWAYTLAVVSICLGLCVVPYRTTVASLSFYGAEKYLKVWRSNPQAITRSDYIAAKNAIEKAVAYHPSFAFYHDMKSEVLQWGRFAGIESNTISTFNDITLLYTHSLSLRTTWAVTWANMGQQVWYTKPDKEGVSQSLEYLQNAHRFGQHIPEVHVAWTEIGFQLMERDFTTYLEMQDLIKLHVIKGLKHYKVRKQIAEGIQASNNSYITCLWLTQEIANGGDKETALIQSAIKRLACS